MNLTNKHIKNKIMETKYLISLRRLTVRLALLLVPMAGLIVQGFGQEVVITNPSSPWTVPVGVTSIKVEVWGGGGGGGAAYSGFNSTRGGGGGGGGAYNVTTLSVVPGNTFTITIGGGGSAGSGGNGGTGGTTIISGTDGSVSAAGGGGGGYGNSANGSAGAASTGGLYNGGDGGASSGNGAGGGGGAGNSGNGSDGGNSVTGTGGTGNPDNTPYTGGDGGAYRTNNGSGNTGNAPGGGGGGGRASGWFSSNNGGTGGAGQVVITYTTGPVIDVNPSSLDFGYTHSDNTSAEQSFTLSGSLLTGAPGNITVSAPTNFEVSLTSGSGFGSSVQVPYTSTTLDNTTIYTRFKPTAPSTDYSGNITNSGDGAAIANVAVSGTSINICYGYARSVYSQSDITNPNNALNAPDGTFAELWDNGDQIVLDLTGGDILPSGRTVDVKWRRAAGTSADPTVTVALSANGSSWTDVGTYTVSIINPSWDIRTLILSANARYIRFTTTNDYNLDLDAVSFLWPSLTPYNVTGGGSYCTGASGLTLGLENSQTLATYQLYKDGTAVGAPVNGTGAALDFGIQTAGTYTVTATRITGGCIDDMNGSAVITVGASPTATVIGQSNVKCFAGNDGSITISANGGTGIYSYSVDNGDTWVTPDPNTSTYVYPGLVANHAYKIRVKIGDCPSILIP